MARGTQFLVLRQRLRAESKRSVNVAVGVDETSALNALINETYSTLYLKHDWPHLRKVFSKPLSAGERYYDFPDGLNPERVEEAWIKFTGDYTPIYRGIGSEHYTAFDSEEDERSDPVMQWDIRWTGSAEQIEVWPIPVTDNQSLRFLGIQAVTPLVSDSDVCLLDDDLIIMFAKIGLLPEKDRTLAADAAKAHYETLLGRTKAGVAPLSMADPDPGHTRPYKAVVVVRS